MTVRRSGGFAGITRTGSAELGDAEQPDVRSLVDAVRSAAAARASAAGEADRFVYHVTFDDEPELTVSEAALSEEVRQRVEQTLTG